MKFSLNKSLTTLSIAALLTITSQANASLIKRTDNLIYDDVSKITWLADAQYAKSSGFDADSKMDWVESTSWASGLSAFSISDWRLPTLKEGLDLQQSIIDFGLFTNLPSSSVPFWSSTEHSSNANKAYLFKLDGNSGSPVKSGEKFAWAVTSGDVAGNIVDAKIPEPTTFAIFTLAIAGLAFKRKQLK
jgi:hypothetical protein